MQGAINYNIIILAPQPCKEVALLVKIMPRGYYNKTGLPYNHGPMIIGHLVYGEGFKKGHPDLNIDGKGRFQKGKIFPRKNLNHTEETKRKIRESKLKIREKTSNEAKKRWEDPVYREKMILSKIGKKKENPITPINELLRRGRYWKIWRKSVFEYDNYTCWICEEKGGKLHPHHLLKFSDYPILRFVKSNGLTLCEFCHKTYTKFGRS